MKIAAPQMSFFAERKAAKMPPPIERRTHIAVADMLRVGLSPGWTWYHVPNGELRSKQTGALLKRMGERPGVSDFILVAPPNARHHALELKRKGCKPSADQTKFLLDIEAAGGAAAWTDSFDGAKRILRQWGAIDRVKD